MMIKYLCLFFLFITSPLMADDADALFQRAKQALSAGQEQQADIMFVRLQAMKLTDKQRRQIAAFRKGHALLTKKKLRLARKLAGAGDCDRANVLFSDLLKYHTTRRAALNAQQRCAPATAEVGLSVAGWLQASLGIDDNPARINQDLNTEKGSRDNAQPGSGFQRYRSQLNMKYPLSERWSSILGAGLSQLNYSDAQADPYASAYQQLNARFNYKASGRWGWRVPLRWRHNQYDGKDFNQWLSIGSQLNWRNRQWRQRFTLEGRQYRYQQASQKKFDGEEQRLAYTLSAYAGKQRIDAGLRWRERRASKTADYDHHQSTAVMRWRSGDACWWQVCSYSLLSAQLYQRSYHANDRSSQYFRRNYQGQSIALRWRNQWADWQFDLNGKWQKRHSNNDTYSYQRWQFDAALGYRF